MQDNGMHLYLFSLSAEYAGFLHLHGLPCFNCAEPTLDDMHFHGISVCLRVLSVGLKLLPQGLRIYLDLSLTVF